MGGTGSGGHNSRSIREHKLRGTFRHSRHGGILTPAVSIPPGDPTPPARMTAIAKREWNGIVRDLKATGTLRSVDGHAIFQCAEIFAAIQGIPKQIAQVKWLRTELRQIVEQERKHLTPVQYRSLIAQVDELKRTISLLQREQHAFRAGIRRYLIALGLTPASRHRAQAAEPGDGQYKKSKLARFMRRQFEPLQGGKTE